MTRDLLVSPVRVSDENTFRRIASVFSASVLRALIAASLRLGGGRGVRFMSAKIARLTSVKGTMTFSLASGGLIRIPIDNSYWLVPLFVQRKYESDLDRFLSRSIAPGDSFIDCGANLGLWSIAVSSEIRDRSRIVAVEAGTKTYIQLLANAGLNNDRFMVLHRAVGQHSGEQIQFFASEGDPASASVVQGLAPNDGRPESVETISLGDLIELIPPLRDDNVVFVKLDIEGNEIQALSSLEDAKTQNVVIIYEDHGRDHSHENTVYLLGRGYSVAFLGDDGTVEPITLDNVGRLGELKELSTKGYNLVAFTSGGTAARRLAVICLDVPTVS